MPSFIINKEVYYWVILLMLAVIHVVCGQQCLKNGTITKCNVNQVLTTVNNCTKCICRSGFYHHIGLGGCQPCDKCDYPKVIVEECSQTSNTKCDVCRKSYYRTNATKSGCKKCQKCKHGVVKQCGTDNDTVCVQIMTKVVMPTTGTEKSTASFKVTNRTQVHDGSGKDWRTRPIWAILFIISITIIIFLIVLLFVMCRHSNPTFYTPTDTTSLATSLSSLLFTKSKFPDVTSLTEEERDTPISKLPGGYAEILAQLLNPKDSNNWVHLAYQFKLTLVYIANLKNSSEPTQDLLLYLCSINTTVEILWKALKNIKRDDACVRLVNFILDLRKDNESAILLI